MAGPTCPVERSDSPCPDRPVTATVIVTDASGKQVTRVATAGVSVPAHLPRAGHLPVGRIGWPLGLLAVRHARPTGPHALPSPVRAAAVGRPRPDGHVPRTRPAHTGPASGRHGLRDHLSLAVSAQPDARPPASAERRQL